MSLILFISGCSDIERPAEPTPTQTQTATPEASSDTPEPEQKHVIVDIINSKCFADNLIGEESEKRVYIYLPPSYYTDTAKTYPVIYNLHGYGDSPYFALQKQALDKFMEENPEKEFIIVEPYGGNSLGGSFYANSPVTGNWEDYLSGEMVDYIDSNYRTIPDKDSRGIAGFSMGGFGALYLGFRHPDVFSSILALGPGVWDENGITDTLAVWDKSIRTSYGSVFSPDMSLPSPYAAIPTLDGSEADNLIVENWKDGFGNWPKKIEAYKALDVKLNAVSIICGKHDSYKFIRNGSSYVSSLLTENGIDNNLVILNSGHFYPVNYVVEYVLPFFNEHLNRVK